MDALSQELRRLLKEELSPLTDKIASLEAKVAAQGQRLLTTAEKAEEQKVSEATIRRWAREGTIAFERIGEKQMRFYPASSNPTTSSAVSL